MSTQSVCQHLEKNNCLRLAYLCQPLRAVYSQICNYKLFRAFKISRRVRWPGWTILLKLTMKTHFYTKYPNRIFVNRIWLHTPREKKVTYLYRYIDKYLTINFLEHLKHFKTIHWAGWTVLLNRTMKTWFLSKITKTNFCQRNSTPYTLKKKSSYFVSVYSQIANSQLFRTLKIFRNGSVSSENRSFRVHR